MDLAPVPGVDGTGRVHDGQPVPGSQPGARVQEGRVAVRQGDRYARRHRDPALRRDHDVDPGDEVRPGVTRVCVGRGVEIVIEQLQQNLEGAVGCHGIAL